MRKLLFGVAMLASLGCGGGVDKTKKAPATDNNVVNAEPNNQTTPNNDNVDPNAMVNAGTNAQVNLQTNNQTQNVSTNNQTVGRPCVAVSPADVNLRGDAPVGQTITLQNCADNVPLIISELSIVGSASFQVIAPTLPVQLAGGGTLPVDVTFDPAGGSASGELVVMSTAGELTIPLTGTAAVCAMAIARGRMGGEVAYNDAVRVDDSGALAELTASFSIPGDAEIDTWQWAMIDRPGFSNAMLLDNSAQTTSFVPDEPGLYRVELVVRDAAGVDGCAPDTIDIEFDPQAGAEGELTFQVTWAPVVVGEEPDIDIHMLHPNGTWANAPWAVFYGNTNPDWGPAGAQGDPSLDVDSLKPPGPENINFTGLEMGVAYRLGAHNFGTNFGTALAADVQARVYWEGALVHQADARLMDEDEFWEVGTAGLTGIAGTFEFNPTNTVSQFPP